MDTMELLPSPMPEKCIQKLQMGQGYRNCKHLIVQLDSVPKSSDLETGLAHPMAPACLEN